MAYTFNRLVKEVSMAGRISEIVSRQRKFYLSGKTLDVQFRIDALKKLQKAIKDNIKEIDDALYADLRKSGFETYMTETGMVLDELRFELAHVSRWARPKRVKTPLAQFLASSFVVPEPYGVTLIMSPWNYPFQLCIEPLIGAIAAGNTVVVKPSAYSPATSACIAHIVRSIFDEAFVAVIEGGREENQALLEEKFDYIFFTGSVNVGKLVMKKASEHLTPVSLELGGKSPVIVDHTADLKLAARRLAFGKYLNAGQTCVAPDYLLIEKGLKDKFLPLVAQCVQDFFPNGDFSDSPVIVNQKHFERVSGLINDGLKVGDKVVFGGDCDSVSRFIAPTVLDNVTFDSPIMKQEIFGPVLPVIEFDSLDWAIDRIRERPRPLALYLFSNDKAVQKRILRSVPYGGGCINDTIIHLASSHMGFGGVGESGMGSYHGKRSFDTFTHYKSIISKSNLLDLPMRYHPYTKSKLNMIKKFMK